MKKLLLKKSRKLILLLLLGFRYIIMEISFLNMMADSCFFIEAASIVVSSSSSSSQKTKTATTTSSPSIIIYDKIPDALSSGMSNDTSSFVQGINRFFVSMLQNNENNSNNINNINKNNNKIENYRKYITNEISNNNFNNQDKKTDEVINFQNYNKKSFSNVQYKTDLINKKIKTDVKFQKQKLLKSKNKENQQNSIYYNRIRYKRDVNNKNETNANNSSSMKAEYEEQEPIVIMIKHENNKRKHPNRKWNKKQKNNKNIVLGIDNNATHKTIILHSEAGSIQTIDDDDTYNNSETNIYDDDDGDGDDEMQFSNTNINDVDNEKLLQNYNSATEENDENYNEVNDKYVNIATTPKIFDSNSERTADDYENQYDYENDVDDDDDNENLTNSNSHSKSFFDSAKTLWNIFLAVNSAWDTLEKLQNKKNTKQKENEEEKEYNKYDEFNKKQEENLKGNLSLSHNQNFQNLNDEERSRRESYYSEIGNIPRIYNENIMNTSIYNTNILLTTTTKIPTTRENTKLSTFEGRYIKGDPLKGYYDFVITEGSYKFWACFQLATAILIIYSTFAAIYYSKVNPLVGDYDYVDYLGGGRSISDNTDDIVKFVNTPYNNGSKQSGTDIGILSTIKTKTTTIWSSIVNENWIPKTGHTMKFILDAIDKIPSSQ